MDPIDLYVRVKITEKLLITKKLKKRSKKQI